MNIKLTKFEKAYLAIIKEERRKSCKKHIIKQSFVQQYEDSAYDKIINALKNGNLVEDDEEAYDMATKIFTNYQMDEDTKAELIPYIEKFQNDWKEFFKTAEDVYENIPMNQDDYADNADYMIWAAAEAFKDMPDEKIIALAKKYEAL